MAADARRAARLRRRAKNTSIARRRPRSRPRPRAEEQPLDPGAEADSRRRRAADLLDETVVAPAAANRVLRAEGLADELERRTRVVVEPAHERRHEPVRDAVARRGTAGPPRSAPRQSSQRDSPIFGASSRSASTRSSLTSKTRRGLVPRFCRASSFSSLVVLVEPRLQALEIRRPAVPVADRVEVQPVASDPEAPQELGVELEDLGVDRRVVRSDRLDRPLPVLSIAALLRTVVPVHRGHHVRLHGLRLAVEPVLDVGAADRRRPLRAECEHASAPVLERVRLLLHDVRALSGRAENQARVLEGRRRDPPVPVEGTDPRPPRQPLPRRLLGREDVVRAARGLEASRSCRASGAAAARPGTGCAQARRRGSWAGRGRNRRRSRAGSARRGGGSSRAASSQSPNGRSTRPTDPANRTSPEKSAPSAANARCPGECPGTRSVSNAIPADLDRLVPLEEDLGRPRADVDAVGGEEVARRLEHRCLQRGDVHRRAGSLGEVGDGADVVEVGVRDEDRRAAGSGTRELEA